MPKLTIMKGLPASGKTTKAKEILNSGNTVRLNKDLLREMLHDNKFTGRNEGLTREASRVLADHFLSKGVNVIIDDTNLNEGTLQGWKDLGKAHKAKIAYGDCTDVPVEECIKRDQEREKGVGKHVIQRMAFQHLNYLKGQKVVICDIDGTIANIDHRLHFVQGEKKDWKGFFSGILQDVLRLEVGAKVHSTITGQSDVKLIFVSARPSKYRKETEEWLELNFKPQYTALLMREDGDSRPDTEVKSDIYEKYLKKMDIVKVFDDRPSVIRMWREKGLVVEDVGKGVEF